MSLPTLHPQFLASQLHLPSSPQTSHRTSIASTTKSTLRHSNTLLVEMLQNIQSELSTHRSIMLDIQSRVSHLESSSPPLIHPHDPHQDLLHPHAHQGPSKRSSHLIPGPEGQAWWQACQNFARNAEPPLSATEFLRTPKRFSGLGMEGWRFGGPLTPREMERPPTPPAEEEVPCLTPGSGDGRGDEEVLEVGMLEGEGDEDGDGAGGDVLATPPLSVEATEDEIMPVIEDEIVERTIEVSHKHLPKAPLLQLPPTAKVSVSEDEAMKHLRMYQNPRRYLRGKKSLATFQAHFKHRNLKKEHVVLIHFHGAKAFGDE